MKLNRYITIAIVLGLIITVLAPSIAVAQTSPGYKGQQCDCPGGKCLCVSGTPGGQCPCPSGSPAGMKCPCPTGGQCTCPGGQCPCPTGTAR